MELQKQLNDTKYNPQTTYHSLSTDMTDKEVLLRALATRRASSYSVGTARDFKKPERVYRKVGMKDDEYAEIILRAGVTTPNCKDIGFRREEDGTFSYIYADDDRFECGERFLLRILAAYKACQTTTYEIPDSLKTNLQEWANFYKNFTLEQYIEAAHRVSSIASLRFLALVLIHVPQEHLRQRTLELLQQDNSSTIKDVIAKVWYETRNSELEKLMREKSWIPEVPASIRIVCAFKMNTYPFPLEVEEPSLVEIDGLIEALADKDLQVVENALAFLQLYQAKRPLKIKQKEINVLQKLMVGWANNRYPVLLELLQKETNFPPRPFSAYARLLLKLGRNADELEKSSEGHIQTLAEMSQDADPVIAERAVQVLGRLKKIASQKRLCQLVVEQDFPRAAEVAYKAGFKPDKPHQQALFYFMAGAWQKYEELDFDHRILRTFYEKATSARKRSLTELVRKAGRPDYLKILTSSGNSRQALEQLGSAEAEVLVQILTDSQEWAQLWQKVSELPLKLSIEALRKIAEAGWQPESPAEREFFSRLNQLIAKEIITDEALINQIIPPAYLRATVRAPGRVNTVAFAPKRPVLAIGTGSGKVVLWNMQTARREKLLTDFKHSVARLAFTREGTLVCAERASKNAASCQIYTWEGEKLKVLGAHTGAISVLETLENERVFSAAKDGQLILWDIAEGRALETKNISYFVWDKSWPRGGCVSPNAQKIFLLNKHLVVLNSSNLASHYVRSTGWHTVLELGVVAPNNKDVIAGTSDGNLLELVLHKETSDNPYYKLEALGKFRRPENAITGLTMLYPTSTLVKASADGHIEFIDWRTKTTTGSVQTEAGRISSLKTASDGSFMAVGNADGSFTLWDSRNIFLRQLFSEPLAGGKAVHLAAIQNVKNAGLNNPAAQNAVSYIEAILSHRFRFDVEISEFTNIQAGEFDIELESA